MFKFTSRLTFPIYRYSLCSSGGNLFPVKRSRTICFQSISVNLLKEGARGNKAVNNSHISKVSFHTSGTRNALPAVVVLLMRPLVRLVAVVFGKTFRIWWRRLPQERRMKIWEAVKKRKFVFLVLLTPLPFGAIYFYATHIEEEPITKRKRFVAFSPEQMIQLANFEQDVMTAEFQHSILAASHPVYRRVHRVTTCILNANKDLEGIGNYPWRIIVVDAPEMANAFVLPNGTIFIFTGMLNICSNDDELSIVLAHEMAHAILGHTAENLSNAQLIELLLFLPLVLIWAVLPDLGAFLAQWFSGVLAKTLLHLPFSRQKEMEADDIGLKLAAKACFDVREAPCFWKKMKEYNVNSDETEWLSTHPSYDTRIMLFEELIPSALKLRDSCQCPKLFTSDPSLMFKAVRKLSGSHAEIERQTR